MDYSAVKTAILSFGGQGSGGSMEDLIGNLVNGVYRDVLNSGPVPHEAREFTFTSVSGQKQYGLPIYVRKVKNWLDGTNDRNLWQETAAGFDKGYPGDTSSGTPTLVFPIGVKGVQAFPNSDGVLSISSDSALDTGSDYKIRVSGYDSTTNILVTELVTMNGTSTVNTTKSYDTTLGVERITKAPVGSNVFSGNVTIKDDDANIICIIPTWWDAPDFNWIQMHPTPSAAIVYTLRAEMRKPPLVNDTDWPEFDQEYHDLLIWGVTKDWLPTVGKGSVAAVHRASYKDRMSQFRGESDPGVNTIFVFSNVQVAAGVSQRPQRPQIPGVDVGLGIAT